MRVSNFGEANKMQPLSRYEAEAFFDSINSLYTPILQAKNVFLGSICWCGSCGRHTSLAAATLPIRQGLSAALSRPEGGPSLSDGTANKSAQHKKDHVQTRTGIPFSSSSRSFYRLLAYPTGKRRCILVAHSSRVGFRLESTLLRVLAREAGERRSAS